ncbi:MAG: OmpA family protein, partial [Pseudomonadota bacterium]
GSAAAQSDCRSVMTAACAERFGAGATRFEDATCRQQWAAYRRCIKRLAAEGAAAAAPSAARCTEAQAQRLWTSAERAGDCYAYEGFREACPGTPEARFAAAAMRRLNCAPAAAPTSRPAPAVRRAPTLEPSAPSPSGPPSAAPDESSVAYFETVLGNEVFFNAGQSAVSPRMRAQLDRQAAWLRRRGRVWIVLEGHASAEEAGAGRREDLLALSAQRAAAVRAYLQEQGVGRGGMGVQGYGAARPKEDCAPAACAAQNRRVAIRVDAGR